MIQTTLYTIALLALFESGSIACADDLEPLIDLSAFNENAFPDVLADPALESLLPVSFNAQQSSDGEACRRFYLSGIIGGSFGTLSSGGTNTSGIPTENTGSATDDLLTGGGAVGMACYRDNGLLRIEVEGRGRDLFTGQTNSVFDQIVYGVEAVNGWSAMANIWRDFFFTKRLGVYGGGGIGAAGYQITVDDTNAAGSSNPSVFAWQIGTGVTYRLGSRTTLDLGYRFLDLGTASMPLILGNGDPAGNYTSAFSASELLLTVRVYEPFRKLRRD